MAFDDMQLKPKVPATNAEEAEVWQQAANLAESWKGRRLAGSDPNSEVNQAFGRGVDMAAHYIAADLRERAQEARGG